MTAQIENLEAQGAGQDLPPEQLQPLLERQNVLSSDLIAGKRYMGHDGKDIGEHDPMAIYWYDFDRETRTQILGGVAAD